LKILVEPRNALVKQYQRLFELDGVGLDFEREALEAIADQAILRQTGARGLRAIMEEVLQGVMYEVPSRKDVARVVITADVVLSNVNPTLIPRDARGRGPGEQKTAEASAHGGRPASSPGALRAAVGGTSVPCVSVLDADLVAEVRGDVHGGVLGDVLGVVPGGDDGDRAVVGPGTEPVGRFLLGEVVGALSRLALHDRTVDLDRLRLAYQFGQQLVVLLLLRVLLQGREDPVECALRIGDLAVGA